MTSKLLPQSRIAELIINELACSGINKFFVSPGSRSTLLAIAVCELADAGRVSLDVCTDERSAAFKCIGFSRVSGVPAALICTSGSAVANYFPAIVEADSSAVPMIVLTADRPDELHDNGNNQTINQLGIYGKYAKYSAEIDCSSRDSDIANLLSVVDFAVYSSRSGDRGVVHLNCKFREPFFVEGPQKQNIYKNLSGRAGNGQCYTTYLTDSDVVTYSFAKKYGRPVFVFGENSGKYLSALKFAEQRKILVFADIMSGMRGKKSSTIKYYDEIIGDNELGFTPDAVFHFGGKIISKKLLSYINGIVGRNEADLLIFNDSANRFDPFSASLFRIIAGAGCTEKILEKAVSSERKASVIKSGTKPECSTLPEQIPYIIADALNSRTNLFLGNSSTIRCFDKYFFDYDDSQISLFFNRGASGIDGNIATISGIATASEIFTLGVIGDLTAFHDLNSLIHLRNSAVPISLMIVNNNGGGIFRKLQVCGSKYFDRVFLTPLDLTFENAADMFSLDYFHVTSANEIKIALQKAANLQKSSIIEVMV